MATVVELQDRAIEYARAGSFGTPALETNLELTRLAPGNEGAWTRLARCYLELGRLDDAGAALDTVLEVNGQNAIARSLQVEIAKRRAAAVLPPAARPRAVRASAPKTARAIAARAATSAASSGAFSKREFASLGQLAPDVAVDAIGPRLDSVVRALNDRPFASRVVETRNRAGRSGGKVYRRNNIHSDVAGHLYALQYGGRWEPQLRVDVMAAAHPRAGRDCLGAGIAFDLTDLGADSDRDDGPSRASAYLARFQQLISAEWSDFLSGWLAQRSAFVQIGDEPPSTGLPPADLVARLRTAPDLGAAGWVFCARWLFADSPDDAPILADERRLVSWIDSALTDLLPLWTSVYRG
jgi:hypothetical protein